MVTHHPPNPIMEVGGPPYALPLSALFWVCVVTSDPSCHDEEPKKDVSVLWLF